MTTVDTLTRARRSLTTIAQRVAGELLGNARASWTIVEAAGRDIGGVVAETAADLRREPAAKARPAAKKRRPAVKRGAALV